MIPSFLHHRRRSWCPDLRDHKARSVPPVLPARPGSVCQDCRVSLVLKVILGWLALSVLAGLLVGRVIRAGSGHQEPLEKWEPLVPPVLQALPDLPEHLGPKVYLANQAPRALRDYPAVRVHRDHRDHRGHRGASE